VKDLLMLYGAITIPIAIVVHALLVRRK